MRCHVPALRSLCVLYHAQLLLSLLNALLFLYCKSFLIKTCGDVSKLVAKKQCFLFSDVTDYDRFIAIQSSVIWVSAQANASATSTTSKNN